MEDDKFIDRLTDEQHQSYANEQQLMILEQYSVVPPFQGIFYNKQVMSYNHHPIFEVSN